MEINTTYVAQQRHTYAIPVIYASLSLLLAKQIPSNLSQI